MNQDPPQPKQVVRARLDDVAESAQYSRGVNGAVIAYSVSVFRRFYDGAGSVLELGPADGLSTQHLLELCEQISVVEGSSRFSELLAQRFPDLTIHSSLFEDFSPDAKFDVIYMSHILEHVDNPLALLSRARTWLRPTPTAFVFCSVPNALSLHRQVGVTAGDIATEYEFTEADTSIGHLRVYDASVLSQTFLDAGYSIDASGGYFLKAFSNSQIEKVCDANHLDALMRVGEKYPDAAADIYVVARPRSEEAF